MVNRFFNQRNWRSNCNKTWWKFLEVLLNFRILGAYHENMKVADTFVQDGYYFINYPNTFGIYLNRSNWTVTIADWSGSAKKVVLQMT